MILPPTPPQGVGNHIIGPPEWAGRRGKGNNMEDYSVYFLTDVASVTNQPLLLLQFNKIF